MMNNALTMTAIVIAICNTTSTALVLLRSKALNIGLIPIAISLLRFQVCGRCNLAGTPGRVQPCDNRRG